MCYNRIVLGGSDYNRSTLARFFTQMAEQQAVHPCPVSFLL